MQDEAHVAPFARPYYSSGRQCTRSLTRPTQCPYPGNMLPVRAEKPPIQNDRWEIDVGWMANTAGWSYRVPKARHQKIHFGTDQGRAMRNMRRVKSDRCSPGRSVLRPMREPLHPAGQPPLGIGGMPVLCAATCCCGRRPFVVDLGLMYPHQKAESRACRQDGGRCTSTQGAASGWVFRSAQKSRYTKSTGKRCRGGRYVGLTVRVNRHHAEAEGRPRRDLELGRKWAATYCSQPSVRPLEQNWYRSGGRTIQRPRGRHCGLG